MPTYILRLFSLAHAAQEDTHQQALAVSMIQVARVLM